MLPDLIADGWSAAERDLSAAARSEEPLPVAAADALRPDVERSPQHASVYGALMLKGAVGAASLGDHTSVRDYLAECDRAAELTGDRNDYWFAFGPTNVAIHRVVRDRDG